MKNETSPKKNFKNNELIGVRYHHRHTHLSFFKEFSRPKMLLSFPKLILS